MGVHAFVKSQPEEDEIFIVNLLISASHEDVMR
jgi:hypothetical protein